RQPVAEAAGRRDPHPRRGTTHRRKGILMAELEQPFEMRGAREVLEAGAAHIERQIVAIESTIVQQPEYVFDLAKSLIESACKTILRDRGHSVNDDLDLPRLFK